jgi:hypothetical protein
MRREYFRIFIGASVIVVHVACYLIIVFGKAEWFTPEQQTDLGLMFVPVTSAYVVAIVRSAIEEQSVQSSGPQVNVNYLVVVSLFTVATLMGLLVTIIQISHDIELARRQILLFEIAFGTVFGLIASDLFGKVEKIKVD